MTTSTPIRNSDTDPDKSSLPETVDLSQKAVQAAIRNEALTHPATLFPGVAGLLGGLSWFLLGSPLSLLVGLGGISVALASLIVNFFFREGVMGSKYLKKQIDQMARNEERALADLLDELRKCAAIPGAGSYVRQGVEQFTRVQEKYKNLERLFDEKLGSGEFALGQVWAVAEQVHLGVLDNLREIVTILRSVSTIDPRYIKDRLDKLSRRKTPSDADKREQEALKNRALLRKQQLKRVDEILTSNEEALTQMEGAIVAIANTPSDRDFAYENHETSINRLRELAQTLGDKNRDQP